VFGDQTNAVWGQLPGAATGEATVDGVDFQTFSIGQAELFVQTGGDTSSIDTAVACGRLGSVWKDGCER
jgi:hypothetical protein